MFPTPSDPKQLPYYAFPTRKISQSKLHKEFSGTANLPAEKLKELIDKGYKITRGSWTEREDKRLRKNWRRICRCYPEYANPFIAFGVKCIPRMSDQYPTPPTANQSRKMYRKYKKFRILERMGYRLDTRLICDIYNRCRFLFCFEKFMYKHVSKLPEEIHEKIVNEVQVPADTKSLRLLCSEFSVSPGVVHTITSAIKSKASKRMVWRPDDDLLLEKTIQRQFKDQDIYKVPTYMIDWQKAAKRMNNKYGYDLKRIQAYRRWLRLVNESMVGVRKRMILGESDQAHVSFNSNKL